MTWQCSFISNSLEKSMCLHCRFWVMWWFCSVCCSNYTHCVYSCINENIHQSHQSALTTKVVPCRQPWSDCPTTIRQAASENFRFNNCNCSEHLWKTTIILTILIPIDVISYESMTLKFAGGVLDTSFRYLSKEIQCQVLLHSKPFIQVITTIPWLHKSINKKLVHTYLILLWYLWYLASLLNIKKYGPYFVVNCFFERRPNIAACRCWSHVLVHLLTDLTIVQKKKKKKKTPAILCHQNSLCHSCHRYMITCHDNNIHLTSKWRY